MLHLSQFRNVLPMSILFRFRLWFIFILLEYKMATLYLWIMMFTGQSQPALWYEGSFEDRLGTWADMFIPVASLSLWHIHHTYFRSICISKMVQEGNSVKQKLKTIMWVHSGCPGLSMCIWNKHNCGYVHVTCILFIVPPPNYYNL